MIHPLLVWLHTVELNVKTAAKQICDLCRRSKGKKLRKQKKDETGGEKSGEGGASEQSNNLQVL